MPDPALVDARWNEGQASFIAWMSTRDADLLPALRDHARGFAALIPATAPWYWRFQRARAILEWLGEPLIDGQGTSKERGEALTLMAGALQEMPWLVDGQQAYAVALVQQGKAAPAYAILAWLDAVVPMLRRPAKDPRAAPAYRTRRAASEPRPPPVPGGRMPRYRTRAKPGEPATDDERVGLLAVRPGAHELERARSAALVALASECGLSCATMAGLQTRDLCLSSGTMRIGDDAWDFSPGTLARLRHWFLLSYSLISWPRTATIPLWLNDGGEALSGQDLGELIRTAAHAAPWLADFDPRSLERSSRPGPTVTDGLTGQQVMDGSQDPGNADGEADIDLSGRYDGLKRDDLKRLAAGLAVARARSLNLGSSSVGRAGAEIIAAAPWQQLRELRIGYSGIGDEGFIALVDSPHLAKLEVLAASQAGSAANDRRLKAAAAAALATSALSRSLRELDLSISAIGAEGLLAVAASSGLNRLETLSLSSLENVVDSEAWASAWRAFLHRPWPSLRDLDLDAVFFSAGEHLNAVFAQAPRMPRLRRLNISHFAGHMTAGRRPTILRSQLMAGLEDLRAVCMRMPFNDLADSPALATLRSLTLRSTGMTDGTFARLWQRLAPHRLEYLDLDSCWIGDEGAAAILAQPSPTLKHLDLRLNGLTKDIGKRLRRAMPQLTELTIQPQEDAPER